MTLPTFLVLGAARSATTSLHYYLDQHPDVAMSTIKEPNFFAFDHRTDPPTPLIDPSSTILRKSVADEAAYEHLFAHARAGNAVGEASPLYLYVREAPEQIRRLIAEPRFVAIVRHPVDRAYSHWLHIRRERPDAAVTGFRSDCEAEMAAGDTYTPYAGASHVLRMGLYDVQLQRYLDAFGREPILVLSYEKLIEDPKPELARVCDHLGIAPHAFDTHVRYNRSGVAPSRARAAISRAVRSTYPTLKSILPESVAARLGRFRAAHDQPAPPPPVPDDLRRRLAEWFAPSVDRLRNLGLIDDLVWEDFS